MIAAFIGGAGLLLVLLVAAAAVGLMVLAAVALALFIRRELKKNDPAPNAPPVQVR